MKTLIRMCVAGIFRLIRASAFNLIDTVGRTIYKLQNRN
jgi:hypothetical protein